MSTPQIIGKHIDTCARCEKPIRKLAAGPWRTRGHRGAIVCDVKLRHYPNEQLKHVPESDTEECGSCGGYHPTWFQGDCRDDRYRF